MVTIDAVSNVYDSASFTVATAQTNNDVKANNATLFNNVTDATYLSLITDQTITVRLNSTSNPGIVVTSSESPKKWSRAEQGLKITNIYVTNASGSTANIKVELYR